MRHTLQANFISQYCGETVGNEVFNVGEYWADLRCTPSPMPSICASLLNSVRAAI